MDGFTLCVSVGPELSVEGRVTDLAHVGVGGGLHAETGMLGRHVGHGSVTTLGLPFGFFAPDPVFFGRYVEEGGLGGAWAHSQVQHECYLIHAMPIGVTRPRHAWVKAFDLEVAACALIGARVGLSPGQGLDFLGGFFGWDPAGDDDESHPAD